ncbi:DUF6327 family protein [Winogradskyella maritima]|nr:DUF6327 family protein [Winogradskyella maritima]
MKRYKNFSEIEVDLKRLNLERQIAWEELKLTKNELVEDVSPSGWISSIAKFVGKYGIWMLVKRFFR